MVETEGITKPTLSPEGYINTVPHLRTGTEKYLYCTNLCDRSAWYHSSTQQANLALADSGDLTSWTSGHSYWIDLKHGRVFDEDAILAGTPGYAAVVQTSPDGTTWTTKVENTWGATNGDYTVNYTTGVVTFNSALQSSTQVRATFHKATTEYEFIIGPSPGKKLKIMYVECQFTTNIVLNSSVNFEIWAYNPSDPTWDPANGILPKAQAAPATIYKKIIDFMQESTGPFATIQGGVGGETRGMQNALLTIPFNYLAYRELKSSQGVEIRVKMTQAMGGEFANATFYCLSETE